MSKKKQDKDDKGDKKGMQLLELAKELGLSCRQLRSFFVSKKVAIPEKRYTFIRLTPQQVEMARDVFVRRKMMMRRPFRARRSAKELAEHKLGIRTPKPAPTPTEKRERRRPTTRKRWSAEKTARPTTPTPPRPFRPPPPKTEAPPPPKEPPKRRLKETRPSKDQRIQSRMQRRLLMKKREEAYDIDVEEELYTEEEGEVRPQAPTAKETKEKKSPPVVKRPEKLEIEPPVTVRELSSALGVKTSELIFKLMRMGHRLTINDVVPEDVAAEIALDYGTELLLKKPKSVEELLAELEAPDEPDTLQPRAPIVAFLGHVDHGKTSLLDRIRRTNVAEHEAGGITQHISVCQIETEYGKITFVDTPGHEAFTALRARGANVTDIVVLVVAADDGVMPQTVEAINHARAADATIIVAINKIDKPNADLIKTKRQLSEHQLISEEWGGDTVMVECSALTGEGVDHLVEMISIVSEMLELKANPKRDAVGYVVEASLTEGLGVVATLIVRNGTLRVGDVVLCGTTYGRVRSMKDWRGRTIREAGPSTPVVMTGFPAVPEAGEKFYVVESMGKARELADMIEEKRRSVPAAARHITLETLHEHIRQQQIKELRLILKADAQGSVEGIQKILAPLETDEVRVRILHSGVGNVSEADVMLADASDAVIVAFNVGVPEKVRAEARVRGVQVRSYRIIYELADDVRKALEGMLKPEEKLVQTGRLVVRQAFKLRGVGIVAGCYVEQGKIERNAPVKIYRGDKLILESRVVGLKRFKDDVKEVNQGYECGVLIKDYDDVQVDDVIEAYRVEEVARKLEI